MAKKIKIDLIRIELIGSKMLKSFYLAIKCQITKKVHKSPIIYGGKPNLNSSKDDCFWKVELYEQQKQINCKMVSLNQNEQVVEVSSQAFLLKQPLDNLKLLQQQQVYFYNESKKIANLTYIVQTDKTKNLKQIKLLADIKNEQAVEQRFLQQKSVNYNHLKAMTSFDQENERYKVQATPYETLQNSFNYGGVVINGDNDSVLNKLDQSSIQQRHPYTLDNSLLVQNNLKANTLEQSCLKKWLKKLNKIQVQRQSPENSLQFKCIIPQTHKNNNEENSIMFNLTDLKLTNNAQQNHMLKSLTLNILDEQQRPNIKSQRSLFECSFSLLKSSFDQQDNTSIKQLKLKNLFVKIPDNKSIQVSIFFGDPQNNSNQTKIQGILIRDKYFSEESIPLLTSDQKIFATLSYKAKKVQNVSVQSLPELQELPFEYQNLQNQQKKSRNLQKQQNFKVRNSIKQRKLNVAIWKKQKEFGQKDIRKNSLSQVLTDTWPQKFKQNTGNASDIQPFLFNSKISNSQKDSPIQHFLKRSNTEQIPYLQLEADEDEMESQVSKDVTRKNQRNLKITSNISGHRINPYFSESPTKMKRQNNPLQSTNLKKEQTPDSSHYFNIDTFKVFGEASSSWLYVKSKPGSPTKNIRQKRNWTQADEDNKRAQQQQASKMPKQVQNGFVIEINSITVIMYQRPTIQEQQNGKFLILKSDQDQTFITDTLFNNHLNLNWKNKEYRFSSSQIQISLYERTGNSSQSQNKHIGKVILKFIDLIKGIKQNFFRAQMIQKGKNVGTLIILYDIFMEKYPPIKQKRNNFSDLKIDIQLEKISRSLNKSNLDRDKVRKNDQRSTHKTIQSKTKSRKRAKTMQSNLKSLMLPPIKQIFSPKKSNNRYQVGRNHYQGGKNIKIGREQRFSTSNMALIMGQL